MIALAYKRLDDALSPVEIAQLGREHVEADLRFGAFAVFQCPLKDDSEPALRMLKVPLPMPPHPPSPPSYLCTEEVDKPLSHKLLTRQCKR